MREPSLHVHQPHMTSDPDGVKSVSSNIQNLKRWNIKHPPVRQPAAATATSTSWKGSGPAATYSAACQLLRWKSGLPESKCTASLLADSGCSLHTASSHHTPEGGSQKSHQKDGKSGCIGGWAKQHSLPY